MRCGKGEGLDSYHAGECTVANGWRACRPAFERYSNPDRTAAKRTVSCDPLLPRWCPVERRERSTLAYTRRRPSALTGCPFLQVLMKAYRAACHYGGEDNDDAVSNEFLITSPAVFNKLMIFVLQVRALARLSHPCPLFTSR